MKEPIRCSLIGLGWLSLPLARQLQTQGYDVRGSTTTPEKRALLQQQEGIEAHLLRLNPTPEGDLAPLLNADVLIVNVPPKAGQFGHRHHPEQMRLLADLVRSSPVHSIIYVSSTSVYPELNRIVVEADVQFPDQSAAPALVEAEHHWLALAPEKTVAVVRCGGLMGQQRIPGKYVAGRTVDSGTLPVNYIHQTDAAGLLAAVVGRRLSGTFNAVAPEHPTREAVYRKSCADFGYVVPSFVRPAEALPYKIVSSDKLIQATSYSFVYPDPLDFAYVAAT